VRQLKESCRRMLAPRESDLPMWSAVRAQGRAVSVRASNRVRTAAVLGLTRPIIAVPRDASAGLTPDEIDQIVLHEYAHVQRYDDWTKLLQVLIGAFFGWHPAVRLMMREIDFEREAACDDYVVDVTGAPRAYARCLTKVIEMMPGPGLAAIPYASSSPHNATTRIERLLDRRRPSGRFAAMPAMAGAVTLGALAFCTVHALPIATDLPHSSPLPGGASLASASVSGDTAEARDARATAVTPDANVIADANGSGTSESRRRLNLRIASASTLPIALPFSRFSPLSQLTDTRLPVSRVPTTPAVAPEAATRELAASPTPTPSSAVVAPGEPVPSATSVTSNAAGTPVGRHPHPSRPAEAPSAPAQHAVTELALGPVASAADPNSLPEASESGHIERAWENTRDATSKAMGVSARAVGTATKTAGDATKIATNKAAAGVKASGVKTARVFGHVKRTLASVF
jgi:hypothetical protein